MRIRLFWRIAAAMILVSLVPLTGLAYQLNQYTRTELEANARHGLADDLELASGQIERYMAEHRELLDMAARQPAIISMDAAQQKPFLVAYTKSRPDLLVVQTVSLDAKNVAKGDDSTLNSFSDRQWYQEIIKGADHGYQTLVSKSTGKPGLAISAPIKDGNVLKGVMNATVDLQKVAKVVNSVKIGQTGYAFLVDPENKTMAHPDKAKVEKQASLAEHPGVKQARAGVTDVTTVEDGGKQWLTVAHTFPQGWVLVLQIDQAEALAAADRMDRQVLVAVAVVAVIALAAALLFSLTLTRPIQVMTKYVHRLSSGDFTQSLPLKRNDELGAMAASLNQLQQNMYGHVVAVKEAVAGVGEAGQDLTESASVSAQAREAIAKAFANTLSDVEAATGQQQEQLATAKETVNELVAAVEQISGTAVHQAAEVSQAATVVGDVGAQAEVVAGGLERLTAAVGHVASAGATGKTTVEGALAGIRDTNESVSLATDLTRELGTRSEAIGTILDEITAIASQTNLLALNAAIEAARAGEAGRGFAVVAEEVRRLADRSVSSAREIGSILAALQDGVRQVSGAMEQGSAAARSGAERAGEAREALDAILEAVSASSAEASTIHEAVAALVRGHSVLANTFQSLAAVAEENSASAEEMAAGGETVREAIGALDSLAMQNFAAIQGVGKDLEQISGAVDRMVRSVTQLQEVNQSLEHSVSNLQV